MSENNLTAAQAEVLRLFFSLPESEGFLLAGGAGLVVVGLSDRPTDDLDLFASLASIPAAADALETAATRNGWKVGRIHVSETFRRLTIEVADGQATLVDLAWDAGPLTQVTVTKVGPTYSRRELAARKVLALFDRAELRDFIDVDRVSTTFGLDDLIATAARIDDGFDTTVLAQMMGALDRYDNEQIEDFGIDPGAMRERFRRWASGLTEQP